MRASRLVAFSALVVVLAACGGVTPIQTAFNKGAYRYSEGNYAAAIAEYKIALQEMPDDVAARFNLAMAYEALALEQDEADEAASSRAKARAAYDVILAAHPDHRRANVNVAAMDWDAGREDAANARLRRVIAADGGYLFAHGALAANLIRGEQYADAEAVLRGALNEDGTNADLNALLGDVLLILGRMEESEAAYAKALTRDPEDLHALVGRGEVAFRAARFDDARSWMQRALYIHPRLWRAHRVLAAVAEEQGRLEDATRHWWEARKLKMAARGPFSEEQIDYDAHLNRLYGKLAAQSGGN